MAPKKINKPNPDGTYGDKELFSREYAYFSAYLHKAVMMALTRGGHDAFRDMTPERMAACLGSLISELVNATACTNLICGEGTGLELVHILLQAFPSTVYEKTLKLRHEVDQISAEPVEEKH